MRVAIITDWLTVFGGAEHAVLEMHKLWPEAPLYTTVTNPEKLGPLSTAHIRPSRLQRWFPSVKKHQLLLLFFPKAMEDMDLRGYDVILSSSHAVGKGILPPSNSVHVCYCHTPMRYAWEMENEYLEDFHVPKFLRKRAKLLLKQLRRWDLSTAKRVDTFIANSKETQKRIALTYGRESTVIPPPVDDRFLVSALIGKQDRKGFIAVGRLVPYKRFDLLIEAANAKGFPLTIIGKGQEEATLKKMAGPTVEFRGYVSDEDLPAMYGSAQALLFPQFEDAGIVPLEALACGTPVIAYAKGGALDSVIDGTTGYLFSEQTKEDLLAAMDRFHTHTFEPQSLREHAKQFSAERFRKQIKKVVEETAARARLKVKSEECGTSSIPRPLPPEEKGEKNYL